MTVTTTLSEQSKVEHMFNDCNFLSEFKQINSTTWEYDDESEQSYNSTLYDTLSDELEDILLSTMEMYGIDKDEIEIIY